MKQQRTIPDGPSELDYFPTPPWATRCLISLLKNLGCDLSSADCIEPAAGGGHMSDVLAEEFRSVLPSDICDHESRGFPVEDFLGAPEPEQKTGWMITNPPFRLADEFAVKGMRHARNIALLCRVAFLEGQHRYNSLFSKFPLSYVLIFSERIAMLKGRVDNSAASSVCYAWFVWLENHEGAPQVMWVPPGDKQKHMLNAENLF